MDMYVRIYDELKQNEGNKSDYRNFALCING